MKLVLCPDLNDVFEIPILIGGELTHFGRAVKENADQVSWRVGHDPVGSTGTVCLVRDV